MADPWDDPEWIAEHTRNGIRAGMSEEAAAAATEAVRADMRRRKCRCSCHTFGGKHMVACCDTVERGGPTEIDLSATADLLRRLVVDGHVYENVSGGFTLMVDTATDLSADEHALVQQLLGPDA